MDTEQQLDIPRIDAQQMFIYADDLKGLRDDRDALEADLKEVNTKIDKLDYLLSEMMAETETQNFSRAGTMFCLTRKTRASVVAESKASLYASLREQGFGDLIYETINTNSLSSSVKEQIGHNNDVLPCWLDGLVSIFEKTTVGVRKSSKK